MRQAAGGVPPAYDAPVALYPRLVRVGLVLLFVAAIGSQVGPWGEELRHLIVERITDSGPWSGRP